jgi:hypothetical protein
MLSRLYKGDGWGGLISTANQKFQKKLRQISHDESPGGRQNVAQHGSAGNARML